jgi:hypothetical protein
MRDPVGEARVLLKLAAVHSKAGDPQAALDTAGRVLRMAAGGGDQHLLLMAIQSFILLAAEDGDLSTAWTCLQDARPLFDLAAPRLDRLRFDWLTARVQAELGMLASAAATLAGLRRRYADEGLPFEAALVSLDLAALYARLPRRGDLRRLARECVALFRSIGVGRETLASLSLLAQAEKAEAAALVADLAAAVERARRSAAR